MSAPKNYCFYFRVCNFALTISLTLNNWIHMETGLIFLDKTEQINKNKGKRDYGRVLYWSQVSYNLHLTTMQGTNIHKISASPVYHLVWQKRKIQYRFHNIHLLCILNNSTGWWNECKRSALPHVHLFIITVTNSQLKMK